MQRGQNNRDIQETAATRLNEEEKQLWLVQLMATGDSPTTTTRERSWAVHSKPIQTKHCRAKKMLTRFWCKYMMEDKTS